MARSGQPNFSGGEVSEAVAARYDVAKRAASLARARNVLTLPQGGFYSRAGLEYCDAVKDSTKIARLVPFIFAADQAYALEFSPNLMRVYFQGGLVTKPRITITAITQSNPATVTAPAHGYVVGETAVFLGVEGMVEINGLRGKILSIIGTDSFTVDIDTTGFSAFTGDTGGVPGDAGGGTGGEPPPPPPGEDPPPVEVPDDPPPPPRPPRPGYEEQLEVQ